MMEFQDKSLTCVDCGAAFTWTAGEQRFFADKQFRNEPRRCRACKMKRRAQTGPSRTVTQVVVETEVTCCACGRSTTVPFRPTQGRPVFCKDCFERRKFTGLPQARCRQGSLA